MVERRADVTAKLAAAGKRELTIPTGNIPKGYVKCYGNQAFKCNKGCHPEKKCSRSSTYHKELRASVTEHGYDKERSKPSLQKLVHKLNW